MKKNDNRAVFLDRDGVINQIIFFREMGIIESPFTVSQFKLMQGAGTAIRKINQMGFLTVVVSNQPGVAMKHFSKRMLLKITDYMQRCLKKHKAYLNGIFYCISHPTKGHGRLRNRCKCRKPKPGMLRIASDDLEIDLSKSYVIGDSIIDVEAGLRAGCKTILVAHLKCDLCQLMEQRGVKPHFIAKDLPAAINLVQQLESKNLQRGRLKAVDEKSVEYPTTATILEK
jgi:D,D-heptose 1,7-bisphosphate phosphatase